MTCASLAALRRGGGGAPYGGLRVAASSKGPQEEPGPTARARVRPAPGSELTQRPPFDALPPTTTYYDI
eukprot:4470370-Alexandrium_andersonii.AAC.1